MEFIKSKMYGSEVNVVFTGLRYFFFSEWYGLFAVAERDEECEGNGRSFFKIYVSDGKTRGGTPSEFSGFALKIIKKNENKYIEKKVEAETVLADVHKWGVYVELVKGKY